MSTNVNTVFHIPSKASRENSPPAEITTSLPKNPFLIPSSPIPSDSRLLSAAKHPTAPSEAETEPSRASYQTTRSAHPAHRVS
ncbi:hypothetical protein CCHR01_18011 [Colletotrichum chrysophilum]|uniref:Uncharacterized protein n=1 Tax=Colletotrichum chrysophilum TaxID=1836956 RepID=A0AAD9A0X8_9PEZI|nr:hypothetical protein CCHR01_18011 [Colletotrichum chrysophilum]